MKCGDAHPGEPDASVSDHHGEWPNADRHHLYRHSGRAGELAQHFARRGYAVYVVDQPGRGRSGYVTKAKMPIMVMTSEASYHAPYDHCTVKYLQQAGLKPTWIRLAELGIQGNSHVMMQEKNNKEIASVIYGWLDKALP